MGDRKKTPDDLELFKQEMDDVRPIRASPTSPSRPPKPSPSPAQREQDERAVLDELLAEPEAIEGLETGEELRFLRPGYQKRFLQRLARGQYSIQDHLDLHHLNVESASSLLLEFIAHSIDQGHSCVRVVHGKGLRSKDGPKLKQMTNRLLRRHRAVVAFLSCRPVDGGTGAVSVLLKDR